MATEYLNLINNITLQKFYGWLEWHYKIFCVNGNTGTSAYVPIKLQILQYEQYVEAEGITRLP